MFKQVFGKTVEAAIKSAKLMYGDDYTIFKTSEGNSDTEASISVITDKKKSAPGNEKKVYFEPSNRTNGKIKTNSSDKLNSLRKIAEAQIADSKQNLTQAKESQLNGHDSNASFSAIAEQTIEKTEPKPLKAYNRVHFRNVSKDTQAPEKIDKALENKKDKTGKSVEFHKQKKEIGDNIQNLLTRFDASRPDIKTNYIKPDYTDTTTLQQESSKLKALHKRFDKLEALLSNQLMTANLDYVTHPVFLQLTQAGIHPSIVSKWFNRIIKKDINPIANPQKFMAEISSIIRQILLKDSDTPCNKIKLFIGLSGSGKTSLIMKLIETKMLADTNKIAAISLIPDSENSNGYYTVLGDFCKKRGVDYHKIALNTKISETGFDADNYSYVLIDTPSLTLGSQNAYDRNRKLKECLETLKPLEIHLTINSSMSSRLFQNLTTLSHLIKPDFLAMTHLDDVDKWGHILPLFEKLNCNTRYLSIGNSLYSSLRKFDAKWFTKNLLNEKN